MILLGSFIVYSCSKEEPKKADSNENLFVESRGLCNDIEYCTTILTPTYFKKSIFIDGCEVEVEYWVKECYDPVRNVNIIKFTDIKFKVKRNLACNTILPYLLAGQELEYNSLLNALYKQVLDKIEEDYMNSKYPSSTNYVIEYVESNCFMYCYKVLNEDEGIQWIDISTIKCGQSCCKRTTPYTRGFGNVWIKGQTTVIGDPICTSMPIPESCTPSSTSLGICNVACDRL